MKSYHYKVLDASGRTQQGTFEGNNERDLEQFFLKSDYTPLKIEEKNGGGENYFTSFTESLTKKILDTELIAFTRQFAAAYGAGMAVAATLDLLANQTTHLRFKAALKLISQKIQSGKGLTESFLGFPRFFDSTYLAILSSGEVSGNLDVVLNYSAGLLEKKFLHKERIKSTFLYPKMVLGMIAITIVIVTVFVIPQFAKLYDKFQAQLPLPTRILVAFAGFVHTFWLPLTAMLPGYFVLAHYLKRNLKFMLWWDEKVLSIPYLGITSLKIELTHFCTTFALLLRSGIKITDATQIAIEGLKNSYLRKQLGIIHPTLESGGTLADGLAKIRQIPALMASMVSIGEVSGTLDALLDRVASLYENETELMLKKLPTLMEPIILSVLFVMVLFLALAVYLPLWKMSALIRR